ncbi:MAG: HIT family protein [Thaumarchaeota archaeon]|nr:HIT family protein [Nitrososphaerota archaeon]MDE0266268.1 HIT family protein [Nitrososphaerota archaeon]MDE0526648.1 HIT family protein [Nitrososphaerota archaeon]
MGCVFCEIVRDAGKGHIIYEDGEHLAFLDLYPITEGHSLVVPKRHHEMITDMPSDDAGRLFSIVPRIARAVLLGTGADAFSLGQNNGRAARQIVPHVHVHVIPRYSGRETMWTSRGMPGPGELADLASRIRGHL